MNATDSDPGPALSAVEMHLLTPANSGEGVVVSTERCTASKKSSSVVRHVAIDVSGTPMEGRFRAGQSLGVLPPGVDAHGKPHKLRLYSIASPTRGEDGDGKVLSTTVKRLIDEHHETHKLFVGVASNYLCDVAVGEKVKVTGPSGKRFVLPSSPEEHDYVFFATGTGIAPFRAMLGDLEHARVSSKVTLVMGSAYSSDLLYDAEMRELAGRRRGFEYVTAISRERQADGHGPMYVQDRLKSHGESIAALLRSERGLIYICGLAGMEIGIFQRLAEILPRKELERYLQVDPEIAGSPGSWQRSMIYKQIRPTRRVFLEVY
jgi:ferredoxin--NADP+ reductase